MAYISDYRDGTVSLTTGTKALVGDGTAWAAIGLQSGDMFMVGGFVALLESVVDDTHITLRDNWGGPTLPAGSSYSIKFSPDQSRVQASVVDLIRRLSNGNIDALTELTLEADRLIYADGPNSLALATLTGYARGLLATADAAAMMTALGATTIGQSLLTAANPGAAQDAIGATAVGKAVLTAADAAAGRTAIGAAGATDVAASLVGVDASLAAVNTALANRLRIDAAQGLTAPQQAQGRTNLALGDMAVQPAASYVPKAGGTFTGLVGFDTPPTISNRPKFRTSLAAPTPSTGMTGYVKMIAGTPRENSGHFATDRFTAPRTGLYGFVGGTTIGQLSAGAQVQLKFAVNGALLIEPASYTADNTGTYWRALFIGAYLTLSANDYVELWLEALSGSYSYGGGGGIFNGVFLG